MSSMPNVLKHITLSEAAAVTRRRIWLSRARESMNCATVLNNAFILPFSGS